MLDAGCIDCVEKLGALHESFGRDCVRAIETKHSSEHAHLFEQLMEPLACFEGQHGILSSMTLNKRETANFGGAFAPRGFANQRAGVCEQTGNVG